MDSQDGLSFFAMINKYLSKVEGMHHIFKNLREEPRNCFFWLFLVQLHALI